MKYKNKKTEVGGILFDSKKEANRYQELKLLEKAGHIQHLELQPRINLKCGDKPLLYPSGRQVFYKADFRYVENGRYVIEDTKGFRTRTYKIKQAILLAMGIHITET